LEVRTTTFCHLIRFNIVLVEIERLHADEERLQEYFDTSSVSAAVSCLSLQWINDLPGILHQIHNILEPDGAFVGAMVGGDSLFELRTALQLAEAERRGGLSIRISPMTGKDFIRVVQRIYFIEHADTREVSSLLSRAGFVLTTVDIDDITVTYPSVFEIIEDLRAMGDSNAVVERCV
jgi:NADH dehydrogenase [ubiquinone] 1 alpha subcomplex assembly factor 5